MSERVCLCCCVSVYARALVHSFHSNFVVVAIKPIHREYNLYSCYHCSSSLYFSVLLLALPLKLNCCQSTDSFIQQHYILLILPFLFEIRVFNSVEKLFAVCARLNSQSNCLFCHRYFFFFSLTFVSFCLLSAETKHCRASLYPDESKQ